MTKRWRALCCLLSCVLLAAGLAACKKERESVTLDATYTLQSAHLNGTDVTKDFVAYTAVFDPDGTSRVTYSYLGLLTNRNSSYSCDGKTVRETYEKQTFVYTIDGDTLKTEIADEQDKIDVVLVKKIEEPEHDKSVDFTSVLFGPDISQSKMFNYCPAILTETENGQEVMHIWYCTNKDDGIIMDHIGYRKGVRQTDGKWLFGEESIVLRPTENTWDARHTCDPAVVRGKFKYHNKNYRYLMAYLGCVTDDYSNNETGIAVAENPAGPWVKVDELNPIVPWADECDDGTWGTGMPALISLNEEGEVLLFFQSSKRGTGIQRWDLSDLDRPDLQPEFTVSLTHNGILNSRGTACRVNIPDFAYDPVRKRFYVCGVTNEKIPPDVTVTRVNSHCLLAYLENVNSLEDLCALLKSGAYTWRMAGYVGPDVTGFERNHNPGLLRDAYGMLPDSDRVGIVVSTGHNSWANENIFTYRLHGAYIDVT